MKEKPCFICKNSFQAVQIQERQPGCGTCHRLPGGHTDGQVCSILLAEGSRLAGLVARALGAKCFPNHTSALSPSTSSHTGLPRGHTCQAIRSLSFSICSWASGCSCRYRSVKKACGKTGKTLSNLLNRDASGNSHMPPTQTSPQTQNKMGDKAKCHKWGHVAAVYGHTPSSGTQ